MERKGSVAAGAESELRASSHGCQKVGAGKHLHAEYIPNG